MRTFTLTLAVALCSFSAKAYMSSELYLKIDQPGKLVVNLNNASYTTCSGNITFLNLAPGMEQLQVFRMPPISYGYCGTPVELYSGCVQIPCGSKVFAHIDCFGSLMVDRIIKCSEPQYGWGSGCGNGYSNGWSNGVGYGTGYGNNGWGYEPVCMPASAFGQLKCAIESRSFESSRLAVAKEALYSNYLSASQVEQIMNLFWFESTKLEFAKLAYGRTIDKPNYYLVNNAFSFESSIDELNRFISSNQG